MDVLFVSVIILLIGVFAYMAYHMMGGTEGFQVSPGLLTLRPTLWWFVDDETNARSWWDFGARNSRLPNRGYLQVALQAARVTQGADFDVVPLLGRAAVSRVLMDAGATVPPHLDQLPATIWRQWALANLLAAKGGLVMVGDSTLCVGPSFGGLTRQANCAMFGITPEEPRAIPAAVVPPASWVGWAATPHCPVWDFAASTWTRVVAAGPTSWSAAEARKLGEKIWATQKLKTPAVFQMAEGSRKADGTQLTAEDFLQKAVNPLDPKTILDTETVYVPMDGDALVRDYRYSWFVRLSAEQILASNFYWAVLAKKYLVAAK